MSRPPVLHDQDNSNDPQVAKGILNIFVMGIILRSITLCFTVFAGWKVFSPQYVFLDYTHPDGARYQIGRFPAERADAHPD